MKNRFLGLGGQGVGNFPCEVTPPHVIHLFVGFIRRMFLLFFLCFFQLCFIAGISNERPTVDVSSEVGAPWIFLIFLGFEPQAMWLRADKDTSPVLERPWLERNHRAQPKKREREKTPPSDCSSLAFERWYENLLPPSEKAQPNGLDA